MANGRPVVPASAALLPRVLPPPPPALRPPAALSLAWPPPPLLGPPPFAGAPPLPLPLSSWSSSDVICPPPLERGLRLAAMRSLMAGAGTRLRRLQPSYVVAMAVLTGAFEAGQRREEGRAERFSDTTAGLSAPLRGLPERAPNSLVSRRKSQKCATHDVTVGEAHRSGSTACSGSSRRTLPFGFGCSARRRGRRAPTDGADGRCRRTLS